MMKFDEIDSIIVRSLMNDARSSLSKIAKECHLSVTAIKKRINKLEEKGIICKAVLTPNMASFGYPYSVFVGINMNSLTEDDVIRLIKNHNKIAGIEKTIGRYDLCLFIFSKSVEELNKLKNLLIQMEGVYNVDINIWGKTIQNIDNIRF
jgi:DNA-binding Lrp family transcriptional regulator